MLEPIRWEDRKVVVSGWFGDEWLSKLFPRSMGPSPAPFEFRAERVLEEFEDGSALIETVSRDRRYSVRDRVTAGGTQLYKTVYEYARRQACVPASNWHMLAQEQRRRSK